MEKMVAFCGIVCTKCPAFIATQKDSNEERKKVAEEWSKFFSTKIECEDINCDGCLTECGRIFSYANICEIRECNIKRDVKNCAYCNEYICEKLSKWFNSVPEAKSTLEEIKKSL
jgi:hypothetical protein